MEEAVDRNTHFWRAFVEEIVSNEAMAWDSGAGPFLEEIVSDETMAWDSGAGPFLQEIVSDEAMAWDSGAGQLQGFLLRSQAMARNSGASQSLLAQDLVMRVFSADVRVLRIVDGAPGRQLMELALLADRDVFNRAHRLWSVVQ